MVHKLVGCVVVVSLALGGDAAMGQGYLIDAMTLNGSFELLGGIAPSTAKATHWDTDPDGDVDNWTLWDSATGGPAINANDSGTEVHIGTATQGDRIAFLQAENATYNLTSHIVQPGDFFNYSWDWVLVGRGPAIAQLAYQDTSGNVVAIPGTESTNPNNAQRHLGISPPTYTALAGDPAIGRPIGLTIRTPPESNFPEVDNFVLSVNVGPGDVNADGFTDLADYGIIRDNFFLATGATRGQGDLTLDGQVDLFDYALWKNTAAPAVLAAIGIPEPSSMVLATVGLAALARQRRRGRS